MDGDEVVLPTITIDTMLVAHGSEFFHKTA